MNKSYLSANEEEDMNMGNYSETFEQNKEEMGMNIYDISNEEIIEIINTIKNGDEYEAEKAQEFLFNSCDKLVKNCIRKVTGVNSKHMYFKDMLLEGKNEVLKAAETYKAGGSAKFTTYAYNAVRNAIISYYYKKIQPQDPNWCRYQEMKKAGRVDETFEDIKEKLWKNSRTEDELQTEPDFDAEDELQTEPDFDAEDELQTEKSSETLAFSPDHKSCHIDYENLMESLEGVPASTDVEREAINSVLSEELEYLIDQLPELERAVLIDYDGLFGHKVLNIPQIIKKYNLDYIQVMDIIIGSEEKLRDMYRAYNKAA